MDERSKEVDADVASATDERVEMKVYVRRSTRDWLDAEALRRFGKERRRNDVVEGILELHRNAGTVAASDWRE